MKSQGNGDDLVASHHPREPFEIARFVLPTASNDRRMDVQLQGQLRNPARRYLALYEPFPGLPGNQCFFGELVRLLFLLSLRGRIQIVEKGESVTSSTCCIPRFQAKRVASQIKNDDVVGQDTGLRAARLELGSLHRSDLPTLLCGENQTIWVIVVIPWKP